jgi:hypothetical protein
MDEQRALLLRFSLKAKESSDEVERLQAEIVLLRHRAPVDQELSTHVQQLQVLCCLRPRGF